MFCPERPAAIVAVVGIVAHPCGGYGDLGLCDANYSKKFNAKNLSAAKQCGARFKNAFISLAESTLGPPPHAILK